MTNNNVHQSRNTLNNTGKSTNKITLNMYAGTLNGNIITNPVIPPTYGVCEPNALDFRCGENSQYIGVI